VEADEFNERLAHIRRRFAAALPGKIEGIFVTLIDLSKMDDSTIDTVVVTHCRLHEMCGIAPSIGFSATGKAARLAETVLRDAAKLKRSLRAEEVTALTTELNALRVAAQSDLQLGTGQG
jgi:hypothetical protein